MCRRVTHLSKFNGFNGILGGVSSVAHCEFAIMSNLLLIFLLQQLKLPRSRPDVDESPLPHCCCNFVTSRGFFLSKYNSLFSPTTDGGGPCSAQERKVNQFAIKHAVEKKIVWQKIDVIRRVDLNCVLTSIGKVFIYSFFYRNFLESSNDQRGGKCDTINEPPSE